MKKYWPILKSDKYPPQWPNFNYRRAPTLRNKVVYNVLDPPKTIQLFPNIKGFFICQKCLPCRTSQKQPKKKETFRSTVTGKEYKIMNMISCTSTHVTYVIECPCQYQYMGRTTRPLYVEHINNIKKEFTTHSLSRNFREAHHRDSSVMTFYGIDVIKEHWRGENKRIKVSQNETKWIFLLNFLQPEGLNIDIDLNCYISNE